MNVFSLDNITAGMVIKDAFKSAGLYATGVGLSGEETSDAIDKLNLILNSYQNNYPLISNRNECITKIKTRSSVIGQDGYVYNCIKSHKGILTYPDDTIYSDGDLCYSSTADNGIIYEVTTIAPGTRTLASDWTLDKNEYYTDGTYFFSPVSNIGSYAPNARPYSGDLNKLYFEKSETSYEIAKIGLTYASGETIVVKPSDKNYYALLNVTTGFNYTIAKTLSVWMAVGSISTLAGPYYSDTYYNAYDLVERPSDTFKINNVYSINKDSNNIQKINEISFDEYIGKFNPSNTCTRPSSYCIKSINNKKYIMLYPLINDIDTYGALKIDRTIRFDNIGSEDDTLNIPSDMFHLISYELAQELAILYGVDTNTFQLISTKLGALKNDFNKTYKYTDSDFDFIGGC